MNKRRPYPVDSRIEDSQMNGKENSGMRKAEVSPGSNGDTHRANQSNGCVALFRRCGITAE
jgi:hypothetical protein